MIWRQQGESFQSYTTALACIYGIIFSKQLSLLNSIAIYISDCFISETNKFSKQIKFQFQVIVQLQLKHHRLIIKAIKRHGKSLLKTRHRVSLCYIFLDSSGASFFSEFLISKKKKKQKTRVNALFVQTSRLNLPLYL